MDEKAKERERKGMGVVGALPEPMEWPPLPLASYSPVWSVVRCSSQATTALAQGLQGRGLWAWAPTTRYQRRMPRSRKTQWITRPLLPSFVFVAASHMDLVMGLSDHGHVPRCTIFLINDKRLKIPVAQLAPLMEAQARGMVADRGPLAIGTRVEVVSGLFGHQRATVVEVRGQSREYGVAIEGVANRVLVPGFLLRQI